MTDFTIDVRDLRKSFGARKVVDGLTLIRSSDGTVPSWHEAEPRLEDVFIHMLSVKGEGS